MVSFLCGPHDFKVSFCLVTGQSCVSKNYQDIYLAATCSYIGRDQEYPKGVYTIFKRQNTCKRFTKGVLWGMLT